MEEPSFTVQQKVLQLVVDRIVVEDRQVIIEHVVQKPGVRLQTEQLAAGAPTHTVHGIPRNARAAGALPTRRRPPSRLQYAQVVKRREGGRMVQVSTGRLRDTGSRGDVFGLFTCQLDRQYQLCRARQPDPASDNRRLTRRTTVLQGPDCSRNNCGCHWCITIWCYRTRACESGYHAEVDPWNWLTASMATLRPQRWQRASPICLDDGGVTRYWVPVESLDQLRTIEQLFPEWEVVHQY